MSVTSCPLRDAIITAVGSASLKNAVLSFSAGLAGGALIAMRASEPAAGTWRRLP